MFDKFKLVCIGATGIIFIASYFFVGVHYYRSGYETATKKYDEVLRLESEKNYQKIIETERNLTDKQNKIVSEAITAKQDKAQPLTINLLSSNWVDNTYTIQVTGVTNNNIVINSPSPSSLIDYNGAEVYCSAQSENQLVFSCSSAPTVDLEVYLLILN